MTRTMVEEPCQEDEDNCGVAQPRRKKLRIVVEEKTKVEDTCV
jgi:hypothetical protein